MAAAQGDEMSGVVDGHTSWLHYGVGAVIMFVLNLSFQKLRKIFSSPDRDDFRALERRISEQFKTLDGKMDAQASDLSGRLDKFGAAVYQRIDEKHDALTKRIDEILLTGRAR